MDDNKLKNIPLIAMCVATLLVCLSMNVMFNYKFERRLDKIDSKLVEVDGRRNAQYGIIKHKIELNRCEAVK